MLMPRVHWCDSVLFLQGNMPNTFPDPQPKMPPPCSKRPGRLVKCNRKSKAPRRRAVRQQPAELPVIILEDDVDDPLNDSLAEEDDLEKAIISPAWPADFGKDISIDDRT